MNNSAGLRPFYFSLFVGLRYLRARRRNRFISFVSMSSVLGIGLGVAVLITVISVMNGFEAELHQRILGMVSHVVVEREEGPFDWRKMEKRLDKYNQIAAVAPAFEAKGMLSHRGRVAAISLVGVMPSAEAHVSIVDQHMLEGELGALSAQGDGIILGWLTARKLGVGVGDSLAFVYPQPSDTAAGVHPKFFQFTVVGLFQVDSEYDGLVAMVHLLDLQKKLLFEEQDIFLRVALNDLFMAPAMAKQLKRDLNKNADHKSNDHKNADHKSKGKKAAGNKVKVTDWTVTHGEFFQAVALEKTMMSLLLLLIVAVAAFNIVSSSVMMVSEKNMDIAVLRTLGASPRSITFIFVVQGTAVGLVGAVGGSILGLLIAYFISDGVSQLEALLQVQFFSAYFLDYLPSEIRGVEVAMISFSAVLLSFLATIYPARQAAKVHPAEALRYE